MIGRLSATSFCREVLSKDAFMYVIRDKGHVDTTGTLCIRHTLEFTSADIESVVVSSQHHGRGYGKELMACVSVSKLGRSLEDAGWAEQRKYRITEMN